MIGPIGITLKEAEDHFDFIIGLTDSQHVCWKITREDKKSVMLVPVNEISPISDDLQDDVEEFRKSFLEKVGVGLTENE